MKQKKGHKPSNDPEMRKRLEERKLKNKEKKEKKQQEKNALVEFEGKGDPKNLFL